MVREFAWARLRKEHPEWTEWELKHETLRYAFGSAPFAPASALTTGGVFGRVLRALADDLPG